MTVTKPVSNPCLSSNYQDKLTCECIANDEKEKRQAMLDCIFSSKFYLLNGTVEVYVTLSEQKNDRPNIKMFACHEFSRNCPRTLRAEQGKR